MYTRKLNREKSFDEARTAVQSQIEKIFQKAAAGSGSGSGEGDLAPAAGPRRYKMHGISHIVPGDETHGPRPTHGIKQAIANHPLARWMQGDTPHHTQARRPAQNFSPILSRHDSIESLEQGRLEYFSSRLSHHSSMVSLSSPAPFRRPLSPARKAGSAPPAHHLVPPSPLRQHKPVSSSLMDLSSRSQQHQAIRLSPLERHSSQLSLIYGPRPGEETMLEQARRISLGSHVPTPSPPSRAVSRHHSQLQAGSKTGSPARMSRSQSHISGDREAFSRGSGGSRGDNINQFIESVGRVNNNTEFRLREVLNIFVYS